MNTQQPENENEQIQNFMQHVSEAKKAFDSVSKLEAKRNAELN
jgi:hypothetical protein